MLFSVSSLLSLLLGLTGLGSLDGLVNFDLEAELIGSSLHGQADATTVGIDLHDLDLDFLADLDDLSRGVDVLGSHLGDVNQALDVVAELDECTEGNDLGDLAVNDGAHGIGLDELQPGILGGLLQAERDALALQVDIENLNLNLVADFDDLGGWLTWFQESSEM